LKGYDMPPALALFGTFGWSEIIILAIIGLLIFGKRLPEVGRSLGKGIVEFKKGLSGIEDEVNRSNTPPAAPRQLDPPPQYTNTAAPPPAHAQQSPTPSPAQSHPPADPNA
jgi:sec-independent protein translocase protein TatA